MKKVIVTITNEVGDVLERDTFVVNNVYDHAVAARVMRSAINDKFATIDEQDELDAELAAEDDEGEWHQQMRRENP